MEHVDTSNGRTIFAIPSIDSLSEEDQHQWERLHDELIDRPGNLSDIPNGPLSRLLRQIKSDKPNPQREKHYAILQSLHDAIFQRTSFGSDNGLTPVPALADIQQALQFFWEQSPTSGRRTPLTEKNKGIRGAITSVANILGISINKGAEPPSPEMQR